MLRGGHVEEGLIERDRLDERSSLGEYRHDRIGCFDVTIEVAGHVDAVGAKPSSDREGHCRPDAEGPRLIGGRHHDPSLAGPVPADDHRLAAVLGMVALFDRCVERVKVAVQDGAPRVQLIRTPVVLASGARKRTSRSPSPATAVRSRDASRAKGATRSTASVFEDSSPQVPAAKPSTRTTASMIPFLA